MDYHNIGAPHLVTATASSELHCPPAGVIVSVEVQSHGSSIQWRGDFHWTLCVSSLIQSGVDIASDGLTPLLNRGSQHSGFSNCNIQRILWTSPPHQWKGTQYLQRR